MKEKLTWTQKKNFVEPSGSLRAAFGQPSGKVRLFPYHFL